MRLRDRHPDRPVRILFGAPLTCRTANLPGLSGEATSQVQCPQKSRITELYREGAMRLWPKLKVGVALLALVMNASASGAAAVVHPPISYADAWILAQEATRVYYPNLVATDAASQLQSRYYLFEVLWTDQGPNGSPHFGAFAVDNQTGNVWNMAGTCTLLKSKSLRRLQDAIRLRVRVPSWSYRHATKPMCDAD
jgi:hypothetical protein